MTLRLPAELEAELRSTAEEDHRSMHQAVVHAIDIYLAERETAATKPIPTRCVHSPRRERPCALAMSAMAWARRAITDGLPPDVAATSAHSDRPRYRSSGERIPLQVRRSSGRMLIAPL
jgi:hypothetical protein